MRFASILFLVLLNAHQILAGGPKYNDDDDLSSMFLPYQTKVIEYASILSDESAVQANYIFGDQQFTDNPFAPDDFDFPLETCRYSEKGTITNETGDCFSSHCSDGQFLEVISKTANTIICCCRNA